ncbi:hypothetical protein KM043_017102 [Ampulex compressa]|nr:hypothetical protein KM043_017102 [Ampulex compressa]
MNQRTQWKTLFESSELVPKQILKLTNCSNITTFGSVPSNDKKKVSDKRGKSSGRRTAQAKNRTKPEKVNQRTANTQEEKGQSKQRNPIPEKRIMAIMLKNGKSYADVLKVITWEVEVGSIGKTMNKKCCDLGTTNASVITQQIVNNGIYEVITSEEFKKALVGLSTVKCDDKDLRIDNLRPARREGG